jgi:hypothetical protein
MSGLIHFCLPRQELHPRPEGVLGGTALRKMLHHLLEAICEAISARREYERLTSMGVGHDAALKAALYEMGHCREAGAHGASPRSAFYALIAAAGAGIDSRRECKRPARLDERLPGDVGLTRSRQWKRDRPRSAHGLNVQPAIKS